MILPLLTLSFVWSCGVLYLLLKWRASPFNTMWPSRALLVIVAFCWQATFVLTTGRVQSSIQSEFRTSSQEICQLFIFASFAVFEPWFCLVLVLSLNIQWPTCVTTLLTWISALTSCSFCCRSDQLQATLLCDVACTPLHWFHCSGGGGSLDMGMRLYGTVELFTRIRTYTNSLNRDSALCGTPIHVLSLSHTHTPSPSFARACPLFLPHTHFT